MRLLKFLSCALAVICFCLTTGGMPAAAQNKVVPEMTAPEPPPPPPPPADDDELEYKDYIYENATMEKISQLYWALGKLDTNNNQHIDGYLALNECDIFKKYNKNEFEWNKIREAARQFLAQSKAGFPMRFAIVQPVYLGKYNFEKQAFSILKEYQINGIRRFEILASNYKKDDCTNAANSDDYPEGLIAELSRPIILESLKMDEAAAQVFTEEKELEYKDIRKNTHKSHLFRDAYVVLKIKFFASQGFSKAQPGKYWPTFLAVLEGFEIYADRNMTKLLYEENYQRTKSAESEQKQTAKSFDDFVRQREEAKKKLEEQRKLEAEKKAEKEKAEQEQAE